MLKLHYRKLLHALILTKLWEHILPKHILPNLFLMSQATGITALEKEWRVPSQNIMDQE